MWTLVGPTCGQPARPACRAKEFAGRREHPTNNMLAAKRLARATLESSKSLHIQNFSDRSSSRPLEKEFRSQVRPSMMPANSRPHCAPQERKPVHLFECDCSVQRKDQKTLEKGPAPNLPDCMRAKLYSAALKLGRALGYHSAATFAFISRYRTRRSVPHRRCGRTAFRSSTDLLPQY
jgi:Carbamoyl-phosphate synthase L chain, ATP binding domain